MIKKCSLVLVVMALVVCMAVPASAFEIGERSWMAQGGFRSTTDVVFEEGTHEFISISSSLLKIGPISVAFDAQIARDSDIATFTKLLSDFGSTITTVPNSSLLADVGGKIRLTLSLGVLGVSGYGEAGYTVKTVALLDQDNNKVHLAYYQGPEFDVELTKDLVGGLNLLVGAQLAPALTGERMVGTFDSEPTTTNVNASAAQYNIGLIYKLPLFAFEGGYMVRTFTEVNVAGPYSSSFSGWYFGGRFGF